MYHYSTIVQARDITHKRKCTPTVYTGCGTFGTSVIELARLTRHSEGMLSTRIVCDLGIGMRISHPLRRFMNSFSCQVTRGFTCALDTGCSFSTLVDAIAARRKVDVWMEDA